MKYPLSALLAGLWLTVSAAPGADLQGTVRSFSGNTAEVILTGDLIPAAGDKATIYFPLPGGEDEVVVATASVVSVGADSVQLKVEDATAVVAKDQQVRITSASPQKRASNVPPAPPAMPKTGAPATRPDHNRPATPVPLVDPKSHPGGKTREEPVPDGLPTPPEARGARSALDHFNHAFQLNAAGERDEAIQAYTRAIALNPAYAVAYFNRACIYLDTSNYDGIISDTNAALTHGYEGKADLYCLRGTGWAGKGDYDKALADHTKAIELNPKHALAYNNRANDRLRKGDLNGALKDCNQSLALDPNSPLPYYNRGFVHSGLRNKEKAVADWKKAVQMRPSYRAELEPHIKSHGGSLPAAAGEPKKTAPPAARSSEAVRRR